MIELDPVAAHATARIFRSFDQIFLQSCDTIKIRNGTSLANRYYFPQ